MSDWNDQLKKEGMPEELPVKRVRLHRRWRKPGTDHQPRKEIPYDSWSATDRWWGQLVASPATAIEALMMDKDDSVEEQEARYAELLQLIAEVDEAALVILSGMSAGQGESSLALETGLPRTEVRQIMSDIRALLRSRYDMEEGE